MNNIFKPRQARHPLAMANSMAILGSARKHSNTAKVLERLIAGYPCDLVDLQDTAISSYNYEQNYPAHDQFLPIIHRIIQAPVTIIATPVYWYSYSTPTKIFIDRFSDLLGASKELGRQLRGRRFALVSTSAEAQPDLTLVEAFTRFCDYLGIHYIGCAHAQSVGDFTDPEPVTKIRNLIKASD